MSLNPTECWSTDSQSAGLRIALSSEQILVLPYDQFVLAELRITKQEHRLRLLFSMHDIVLTGANLGRVQIAMQKKELAYITKVSRNYELGLAEGAPVIYELEVKEVPPAGKPTVGQ